MIETYKMNVRLTFTNELLATSPQDMQIYQEYIADSLSNDGDNENIDKLQIELNALDEAIDLNETQNEKNKKINKNVFLRQNGEPVISNHQIKGFFKDTCSALKKVPGAISGDKKYRAFKKFIDGNIFVEPVMIPVHYDGEIRDVVRPLRANTPQGERVTLACSETINAGATIEFTIIYFDKTDEEIIEEWLNHGKYRGILQWRNAGKGTFTWEKI